MRRALLVTLGTAAGLATVLSYSDGQIALAGDVTASGGTVEGLGAPPPDDPGAAPADGSGGASPTAKASKPAKASAKASATGGAKASASATAKAAGTAQTPAAAPSTTKAAAKPSSAAPKPSASATTAKPAPPPTPKAPSGDFVGSAVSHKYGTVQVGIRVANGVITKAWAVKYPTGDSQPYTEFAIPKLTSETVGAKSANVAAVAGATLTSKAWVSSLASAMAKAGL